MKLRNKRTGEIVPASDITVGIGNDGKWYDSLAELNEEWEDVPEEECEELKKYWSIFYNGTTVLFENDNSQFVKDCIEIGNCFKTREEAKKAVEKLKAWKRLKDRGFRFDRWENDDDKYLGDFVIYAHIKDLTDIVDELDLLFGGAS